MKTKKRILLLVISAFTLLSTGCETRKFTQIVSFSINETYEVSISGEATRAFSFNRADIIDQLNFPEKMRVTDAYIESISGTVSANPANQASSFHTRGELIRPNGKRKTWDTQDKLIPLSIPIISATFNLANSLIQEGIEDLADQVLAVLADPENPSTISMEITVIPSSGQLMVVDVNFQITASVEYEFCEDVLPFSDTGEECDF